MLEISKKTEYGLELIRLLAVNYKKGPVSLSQLAERSKLPYRFLGQVVIPLREAGLIYAEEGVKGGYFLSKKPEDITLFEVVETLEGSLEIADCLGCRREVGCQQKSLWRRMEKILYKEMEKKTLRDLI